MTSTEIQFAQPLWLLTALAAVPLVWLAWKPLGQLGPARRIVSLVLRVGVVAVLAMLLARPMRTQTAGNMTLLVVLDRSRSVPQAVRREAMEFLGRSLPAKRHEDRLAVVDVAEAAAIRSLPSSNSQIPQRNTTLAGQQSDLGKGVQMAMAIAPPNTASRILLISDGNETTGDLAAAARLAAANHIPIDVLPLRYKYEREVVFRRLVTPTRASSGQTITIRAVLGSTTHTTGRLLLSLNDNPVDLDPTSDELSARISLKPGTNVKTASIPVGTGGMHRFEATFIPDDPAGDQLPQNNRAAAMTAVAGPGHVVVFAGEGGKPDPLIRALKAAKVSVKLLPPEMFPESLEQMLDIDAVILLNTDNSLFSLAQQEMLCRYVTELAGGVVVVGGPNSFGAGGWIGSPIAEILPLDMDPPQKKVMPKGALVLIMHACEMPRGNYWSKQVAVAAIRSLSKRDLLGVLEYTWDSNRNNWVYPLGPLGDKKKAVAAVNQMQLGDMPDLAPYVRAAFKALKASNAGAKHIIIISDGDPSPPSPMLLANLKKAGITCTGVAVAPHGGNCLPQIAKATGGRYYLVKNPNQLPQIFIKEAQVVRRALIVEKKFTPAFTGGINEVLKSITALPVLQGYVLTGPKGGLNQVLLASDNGDPVLAVGRSGLGRCAAFTSTADSRWAGAWLGWGGYGRFWEQVVRWASRPRGSVDCEVFTDIDGRRVTLTVEATEKQGKLTRFAGIAGQVIAPDMSIKTIELQQVGPGRYHATFDVSHAGSHLVNLRYQLVGAAGKTNVAQAVVTVPFAPEFRDLKDNTAALHQVAAITGGRVLSPTTEVNLFDRAALQFPQTAEPLTKPLMILWLALFLLDVAVRRIAVDVRAGLRRAFTAIRDIRKTKGPGKTLEKLQSRRKKVQSRLAGGAARAKKRFTPSQDTDVTPLDESQPEEPTTPKPKKTETKKADSQTADTAPASPMERLLRAKRKAQDKMDGKNK
ncbi:MAG: VWA domain-containing protein [Phycisphaerae bacterium]|nr:VWA domain-containing protein [Phycisphaerae bacterium]